MKPYSVTHKSATSGSNLRGKLLATHRAEVFAQLRRPFERLAREYRRSIKKMFSKVLVNRIHFIHDFDPLVLTDIYSLKWPAWHTSSTSCGINFTTPAAGRLRVRSEVTYQFPSLDSTMPHIFEVTTDEVIPANSGVQILAGTQIFIRSEIDDMATYVDALLGWQLQKLTINIV